MRGRIFNICQYERNPKTGEDLHFTEENIERGLSHKSIKQWGYILHDKDKYTEEDDKKETEEIGKQYDILSRDWETKKTKEEFIKENKKKHKGYIKPRHWHIVFRCDRCVDISSISKWFGIEEKYIEIPKGKGSFLDCIEYLTHSNERSVIEEKYRYDDSEVKSNFDFRDELDKRGINRGELEEGISLKNKLRLMVKDGELSLREVERDYPEEFVKDYDSLCKFRSFYLRKKDLPLIRYNFYISGSAGVGKGISSILLARRLFPDMEDEEIMFHVGAEGTNFEGYDGQPVVIWDDCRSGDLIKKLGGRGNVFNVFDSIPKKQRQNIKYGSVNLVNQINIVNSVQSYEEFLNGLVGEYKDKDGIFHKTEEDEKKQSYRRFPFIIPLRQNDFDILINRGFIDDTDNYLRYYEFLKIRGNFGRLVKKYEERSQKVVETSQKMFSRVFEFKGICDKKLEDRLKNEGEDDSEFDDYGEEQGIQ